MKEAYGGTFMLYIFMIFFIIFVSIIGVALNFAKIYRIKNNVINILEQYQYRMGDTDNAEVYSKIGSYLKSVPYSINLDKKEEYVNDCLKRASNDSSNYDGTLINENYGVCVVKKGEESRPYYSVTVYFMAEIPVMDLAIPITASGETISY